MRIGVDLGGTKIEALALDERGRERLRRRVATPQGDYRATLRAIAELVTTAEQALGCRASVGVGTPGAISPATGLLKNSNSTCLNGKPLRADLEALLQRPVRIANDADCFALSEATDGAAAGADTVFGVIVGTGTGGGIVCHGRLLAGINAIAGEWGHNPLPWPLDSERPGPACYCGRRGCIETWLSGPALERDYRQAGGEALGAVEIAAREQAGERLAVQVLDRYVDRMARALATVINVIDPEFIVLGGGVGNIARLYSDVPDAWSSYVFSDHVGTRLVAPRFGDSSGVRGAAWLWPHRP
ncbi:MAG TPA: ROK family protein [Gammaproteobacteria bacterium]|nr:ROK family protein [Gammaproteobacteria bacterium]